MSTYVPPNSRKVECSRCGQHMCKKQIDFHLKVYGNGNGAYLTHKATSTTLKVFELHHNGKAIKRLKTKSLFAMFGHKTNQKKGICLCVFVLQHSIVYNTLVYALIRTKKKKSRNCHSVKMFISRNENLTNFQVLN
eukprot:479467_1